MSRTHALSVTVGKANEAKQDVDSCRKELHAMVKRLSTMKRQLLAQKEYIEVAVKDALAKLAERASPYNTKPILNNIVDYRVKLYKHRAFIGRLNYSGFINDMHAAPPANNDVITAGVDLAIKSGGGLKVPIFNSSQILPGVTTSSDDPERIALTADNKEVFNGVDITGTKQFLIGVNAILTHPNNISETLVPSPYLNPAEEKRSYSSVWSESYHGALYAKSMIDSVRAWVPQTDGEEWMKIELPSVKLVTGVVTQGNRVVTVLRGHEQSEYVRTLKVKTSIDDDELSLVDSDNIFEANTDSSTLKTIPFKQPVLAKYVIIYPQDHHRYPSMRAGVLVAPLEDTPYKSIGYAGELREFNVWAQQYTPGLKHALSTGVLKGLLMQGNENITGTVSSDTILTAIPTGGIDLDNNDYFKVIRGFGLD